MEEPFITQIVPYAFNYAPRGWAFCDGSKLTAAQYAAVFALLGNLYNTDGDGRTTFNLPDLRGRAPIHRGIYDNVVTQQGIAYQGGTETFQVPAAALPIHTHQVYAQNTPPTPLPPTPPTPAPSPAGQMYATLPTSSRTPLITGRYTATPATTAAMDAAAVSSTGANAALSNQQPSLALNFCIALSGIYPQRQ